MRTGRGRSSCPPESLSDLREEHPRYRAPFRMIPDVGASVAGPFLESFEIPPESRSPLRRFEFEKDQPPEQSLQLVEPALEDSLMGCHRFLRHRVCAELLDVGNLRIVDG